MYARHWHCRLDILLSILAVMISHGACQDDVCSRSHCLYGRDYCDPDNGRCLYGCMPGYVGPTCSNVCVNQKCTECITEDTSLQTCTRCPSGMYGPRCNLECSKHCFGSGDVCDQFGNCFHGCESLYYGNKCNEQNCSFVNCELCAISNTGYETCARCDPGFWWEKYNRRCIICEGHCLHGDNDCTTNGKCLSNSCQPGWSGTSCRTKCKMENCVVCARLDGEDTCVTCENGTRPGATGCIKCTTPNCVGPCDSTTGGCPGGCKDSGFYGFDCNQRCESTCNASGSVKCDQNTGKCFDCPPGRYGPKCQSYCSFRCQNSVCERSTGNCLQGCSHPGFTGPKCDISCTGPCEKKCVGHCVNDTCDGVSHVCSMACEDGWYGDLCKLNCSNGCATGQCHRTTGYCSGHCVDQMYGQSCGLPCGTNCVDIICDKEEGRCLRGCNVGYHGSWCRNICPDVCLNQTCSKLTGACLKCGVGLQGDQCDQACDQWRYGLNCESVCGRCAGGAPCNATTGHCTMGCLAGWTGIMCDQESEELEQGPTTIESSEMSPGVKAAIGCSVVGVVCCLVIVAGLCWWKRRSRTRRKTTEEPPVTFSGTQANIEMVHQPSTSILLNTPGNTNSSSESDSSTSAGLLGDGNRASQIRLGDRVHVGTLYNIHKGTMMSEGQSTQCCIKLYHLSHPDIVDRDDFMHKLKREIEILFLCRSSNNVMKLLTTAQASDFYCIAMDTSLATGLLPYLHEIQTGSGLHPVEGTRREDLVRIAVDVCTAVKHMHELKVIHRALRAGHVYLSNSLVAKVGDFDWAERMDSEEEAIPRSNLPSAFTPWMAPECLVSHEFSYQSDIWSLGILLWEIFALGESPYQDLSENDQRQAVLEGMHPPKPPTANSSMYHTMKGCWKYEPVNRLSIDHTLQQLQAIQVSMRLLSGTGHPSDQADHSDHVQVSGQLVSDSVSNQPGGDISNRTFRQPGGDVSNDTFRQPVNAQVVINNAAIAQSCPDILGASMKLGQTNRQIAQSHMNIGQYPHAGDSRHGSEGRSHNAALRSVPDTNKRLSLAVDTTRLDTNLRYNRPYQSVADGLDRRPVYDRGVVRDVGRIGEVGHRSVGNSRGSASCSDRLNECDRTPVAGREQLGGPYEGTWRFEPNSRDNSQRPEHLRDIPQKLGRPNDGTQRSAHERKISPRSERHCELNDRQPSDTNYHKSCSAIEPLTSRSPEHRYRSGGDGVQGSSGFTPPSGDGSSRNREFRPPGGDGSSRKSLDHGSEASRRMMRPPREHEPAARFPGNASTPTHMSENQPYRDLSQGHSRKPYGAQRQPLRANLAMAKSCPDIAERSSDLGQTNRELARSYMDIGRTVPRVVDIDIDTPI